MITLLAIKVKKLHLFPFVSSADPILDTDPQYNLNFDVQNPLHLKYRYSRAMSEEA